MAATPSNRLFVADLPAEMTEEGVAQILGPYGQIVSCKVLPPRQSGDKCAAIIEFANQQESEWICTNLNGNIAEGLTDPIVVRYANPTGDRSGSGGKACGKSYGKAPAAEGGCKGNSASSEPYAGGKSRKGSGKGAAALLTSATEQGLVPGVKAPRPDDACVYVRGLPSDTRDCTLYELFCGFGAIPMGGVKAMLNPDGSCSGVGFVDMMEPWMAEQAIQALNGFKLNDGSSLFMKTKSPSKGKGKGKAKGDLV
mmetsp:Transcript_59160/g.173054  ORF Transcript_59160/g.173054 Transcript_59160/m.173054 type:complete len:254 (+) Transcript_59160:65-826(+)